MKLYRKDNVKDVTVMGSPFDGAQEIEVMSYEDLRAELIKYFESHDILWNADAMLDNICQNGEGEGPSVGSDYDETRFDAAYCSDDEKVLYAVFGGDHIYEYCRLTWDEDGEFDIVDPNEIWYRVV